MERNPEMAKRYELSDEAWVVWSAQVPAAQYHQTSDWLAKREPQDRDTFRQACEKLCRLGLSDFFHAVFASFIFVQSLDILHCVWP